MAGVKTQKDRAAVDLPGSAGRLRRRPELGSGSEVRHIQANDFLLALSVGVTANQGGAAQMQPKNTFWRDDTRQEIAELAQPPVQKATQACGKAQHAARRGPMAGEKKLILVEEGQSEIKPNSRRFREIVAAIYQLGVIAVILTVKTEVRLDRYRLSPALPGCHKQDPEPHRSLVKLLFGAILLALAGGCAGSREHEPTWVVELERIDDTIVGDWWDVESSPADPYLIRLQDDGVFLSGDQRDVRPLSQYLAGRPTAPHPKGVVDRRAGGIWNMRLLRQLAVSRRRAAVDALAA